MELSNDLISAFAKLSKDEKKQDSETIMNGTIVYYDDKPYVRLDGSELLTPVETTASCKDDDRVMVLIKNHTATVLGNMTSPSLSSANIDDLVDQITEVEILVAKKVSTDDFDAQVGRIDYLVTENVTIKDTVTATEALVVDLTADNVVVKEQLKANEASIKSLNTAKLNVATAKATYATIGNLDATNAIVYNLQSTYGDINTLIFGSATGDVIQTSFANAVVAQLGNAQIKSAMIESISASQILAGDIITNNVRVMSEDGKLLISDETLQISDDTRVRVQIGKDASDDYSINIWDATGNLMFSEGGITDNAIKDPIIRDDMVSDTANISAHKLNIDTLFEEINGSNKTIKSSKIYLDSEGQTLDIAFVDMGTYIGSLNRELTSQGTELGILSTQINTKVWMQDFNSANDELLTKYSELQQTADGLTARVVNVESTMVNTDDVESILTNMEETDSRVSSAESLIQQLSNSISMLVTDGEGQSLMTQTENGWTFSTESIQQMVNNTSENLALLMDEVGNVTSTVDVLEQAVSDIGVISDYVKIGTYENEPCIELGESDSDFKLVITNTRIMFMEGSGVPAYINNQSLFIKKAVVEEELQQGEFVWKARANGNLGLIWKGAAS